MIALCAVLCGGESCVDMADFAEEKEGFLRGFLLLSNGLPSHDTFSRLFRALDPEQFRLCFRSFMALFAETCRGVVAIDGKVLRRSFDTASAKGYQFQAMLKDYGTNTTMDGVVEAVYSFKVSGAITIL